MRRIYLLILSVFLSLMLFDGIESCAESNKESKTILLESIIKIHPKWQLDKEREIEVNKLLIMAHNPVYPLLKPIWLLEAGKIYSINGAAKTLTPGFQFDYTINPMDAVEILEQNRPYKRISNKTAAWTTPQEGLDVLKAQGYITENEASIMKKLDEYIEDPKNPDSNEAIAKWAKENDISPSRIKEIDIMRFGYKTIDDMKKDGHVRVGEKGQHKVIGKPTGELIKVFKVSLKRTNTDLHILVETDLPDGAPLMCSLDKSGLKGSDKWIGNEAKTIVTNGKAEAKIPLKNFDGNPLKKGSYDVNLLFNSFWSAFQKDVDPNVKLKVGEFGENIHTPYDSTYTNRGKIYRAIKYNKQAAFSIQ